MVDDPVALLERELVEAARRRARGRSSRRPSAHGRIAGVLATAAALVVALLIAGGALILLDGSHRAGSASRTVSGRQQLVDLIAVLRRPQTSADLRSPAIAQLLSSHRALQPGWGAPDRALIRRATVSPWGQGVFLIPVKPAGGRGQEGLAWETRSAIDCCATAADMKTFGEVNNAGQVHVRHRSRGEAIDRFVAVVPDGVAKVQLGQLVMPVHDNVAAAQASGDLVGATPVMFWFDRDGNVIRRIGMVAGSYRSFTVSAPGPQTAASRAAERDPSSPNPVWVTPAAGGSQTAFSVHFRVLLNAAGYTYRVTGGGCHVMWRTEGAPDDSRGRIWSDGIVPFAGQSWCPGTYRVAVTVGDLGPAGPLRHPAKPFGAATFVVR